MVQYNIRIDIIWFCAEYDMAEFAMVLYCIIWCSSARYGTVWNETVFGTVWYDAVFGTVLCDTTWYGEGAQGGSKFHLITTQASAQPI